VDFLAFGTVGVELLVRSHRWSSPLECLRFEWNMASAEIQVGNRRILGVSGLESAEK
jgi:hypothetical protein